MTGGEILGCEVEQRLEVREPTLVPGARLREGEFQRTLRRVEDVVGSGGTRRRPAGARATERASNATGERSAGFSWLGPRFVGRGGQHASQYVILEHGDA
jgi:hypothetical protein